MVARCPFCDTDLTHIKASPSGDNAYYSSENNTTLADHSKPIPGSDKEHENRSFSAKTEPVCQKGEDFSKEDFSKETSSKEASSRHKKKLPPTGRRFLGYRLGNPLYMLASVTYHMAAATGILYALSLCPAYQQKGTLLPYLCRVILAAFILFLPALVLSDTRIRRKLPFFRNQKTVSVRIGLLVLYIPLIALFLISCYPGL